MCQILYKKWFSLFFLFLFLFSCSREDMFETAKNGSTVIYAITSNGSYYKLIIANHSGYLKEYTTGITDSGTVSSFAASGNGTVVFSVGTSFYTHDKNSYSSWSALAAPGGTGTINGICGDRDRIYAQVSNLGLEYIYYLDTGTKTWANMGQINTSGTFVSLFYSPADNAVYHYRLVSGLNLNFYRISSGSAILEASPSTGLAVPLPHSMKYHSYYYLADTTSYFRIFDNISQFFITVAPISSPSYVVIDPGTIYAGSATAPNVYLYRLNLSTGSWDTPLMSSNIGTGASITIKAYDNQTLAIGMISAGTGGLFVFNINTNELKQLTPMKIQQLDVK